MITNARTPRATSSPEPVLAARDLHKTFPAPGGQAKHVLDGINLSAQTGEIVCIVGPSGAGKTTLLRCLAQLMQPTSGKVLIDGVPVTEPPPQVAVVFQDYSRSLMPWASVLRNTALPLATKVRARRARIDRARAALDAVGLTGVEDMYPWQLSGGMQQRVAIARALAYQPEVLLMDEPFASVDAQTRFELEDLVLDVRKRFGVTVVLVTHDVDEAVYLADRVDVLSGAPAHVIESLSIDLGAERDQVTTRSNSEFVNHRARVLGLIRVARDHRSGAVPDRTAATDATESRTFESPRVRQKDW